MDYLLGQILLFPYNFVPQGWLECNGQILNVNQNSALFSLISNTFGGNGSTTFALPNLTLANPVTNPSGPMRYFICTQGIYPDRG